MMPAAKNYFIEIQDEVGATSRVPLHGDRMVVGRSAQAEIRLDNSTVSRQHALMFKDPFDRWWIRDLGSRNGTRVNQQAIEEQVLAHGDEIRIESFRLTFGEAEPSAEERFEAEAMTITDTNAGDIKRLRDFAPPMLAASHLTGINEFGTRLLKIAAREQRLAALCELLIQPDYKGRYAAVMRIEGPQDGDRRPKMLCTPAAVEGDVQPYISRTLLRMVQEAAAPVVASNVVSQTGMVELSLAGNVMELAAVACPVQIHANHMDVLYATFPAPYGTGEWLALSELIVRQYQQAETAWTARKQAEAQAGLERELERAHQIQLRLVPRRVKIPNLDIGFGFEPCRWVGGDYIDAMPLHDGRALLIAADVCGKGLQAALITASLHSMAHAHARNPRLSLAEFMFGFNEYLVETLPAESFVTMVAIALDTATGELELANAGHPPPMMISRDGNLHQLPSCENIPLGLMSSTFAVQADRLAEQHLLALYTDGLSELQKNGGREMLGVGGVANLLTELYTQCPAEDGMAVMCRELKVRLDAYQGSAPPSDDRTYLLAQRVSA